MLTLQSLLQKTTDSKPGVLFVVHSLGAFVVMQASDNYAKIFFLAAQHITEASVDNAKTRKMAAIADNFMRVIR